MDSLFYFLLEDLDIGWLKGEVIAYILGPALHELFRKKPGPGLTSEFISEKKQYRNHSLKHVITIFADFRRIIIDHSSRLNFFMRTKCCIFAAYRKFVFQ